MAFNLANFAPLGNQSRRGKAPQVYTYASTDGATTQDGSGYFNAATAYGGAYNMLDVGDIIIFVVHTTSVGSGTISDCGILVVKEKSAGTLDTSNAVDFMTTDTD